MEFYEVIRRRRSIRAYRPDPVPEDALERIWTAVQLAPTACNNQPFRFVVLRSDEAKAKAYRCYKSPWLRTAPLIVVALGNREQAWKRLSGEPIHAVDTAIAFEHFVLAAAAEGLGTCWVCAFDQDALHRELGAGPEWEVIALSPLGYPAETPAPRPSKPVSELVQTL